MALSDRDIKKAIAKGKIKITPTIDYQTQLGSCSIDLRLSNIFRTFNHAQVAYIDPADKKALAKLTHEIKVPLLLKNYRHLVKSLITKRKQLNILIKEDQ